MMDHLVIEEFILKKKNNKFLNIQRKIIVINKYLKKIIVNIVVTSFLVIFSLSMSC